ncbi:3-carboxy-cis,cis-muconate cycloisomerase [Kocuria coralli]|uniref:3-carboxy-cis,cis-muconate cycloisomerase n=1 Tax=Kocuria coralli TaxID=1461025 RepID=A0A5J5L1Y4_9MICC|nr:lyase family protein [Kocuria coralli]KAA9395215.1 3-carboxy-cis,cis-muconate cycloisomerase [Kocuria coralli]
MTDYGLLEPGTHRVASMCDDDALLRCLVEAEVAWVRAQAAVGLVPEEHARAVSAVVEPRIWERAFDPADIAARAEAGGNPVIPMLADLREAVRTIDPEAVRWIHRGLTSQDVMDTGMMLMARHCLRVIDAGLGAVADALAALAGAHRNTPAVARTLTQQALPSVFGLRCARWLTGILDARDELARQHPAVAVGGAAGTLAGTATVVEPLVDDGGFLSPGDPDGRIAQEVDRLNAAWAAELGLAPAPHVWHTARGPIQHLGSALAGTASAMGTIANDVLLLSRPEIGELREPTAPGRGVSSAMPQKQNPVLSVLLKRTALTAPQLAAQLFVAGSAYVDERPDGAWHAEWPAVRGLLRLVSSGVLHCQELVEGLQVFPEAMMRNLEAAGPGVVAERISAVLAPVVTTADPGISGKSAVQRAIGEGAGDTTSTVELLLGLTEGARLPDGRAVTRELVDGLCDPGSYTGLGDHLIDAALQRYDQD